VRREWFVPFLSVATRLRDTTTTPYGLVCQCPWTALTLLAIVGEARLAMNIDKLTESGNINWAEYLARNK
jgi:hypothetical protein